MIGNDIVDLPFAENHSRCREKRFWAKVLLECEWQTFEESSSDLKLLWACWAAKESAYKLERRQGRSRRFCPKDYVVDWKKGSPRGSVCGLYGRYELRIDLTTDWVHAKCWPSSIMEPRQRIGSLSAGSTFWKLPWRVLSRHSSGALSAGFCNSGPHFPVSKSHHGRFQAYVWSATECQDVSRKAG